ncbi:MAG: ATP-binding protein [Rhizonema sp. PD37]|nr:ATP-binding protein [Rhizonema sp. PD37]
MDSKEALEFINRLFKERKNQVLNELEKTLFLGFWEDKSYKDIVTQAYVSEQHLRDTGAKFCKKITEVLGIEVTKKNFHNPIEDCYKENFAKFDYQKSPLAAEQEKIKEIPNIVGRKNRIFNPFIPQHGRVENPQQFFGREREIQRVLEILNSGSSVALIGEEGIGKSSLLWMICQKAESFLESPRQSVFVDLNEVDNEEDLYSTLCHEVGIPESTGYMLNRNLRQHKNKVLLALDNVGKMTRQGFSRQVRDKLRGLSEGSNAPLKLILGATLPLNDLFNDSHDEGKTSPLAGICQEEHIQPWEEITTRAFISSRLAKTAVNFTEEEIIQLVQESDGHPKRLMQLCYRIYARYLEGV